MIVGVDSNELNHKFGLMLEKRQAGGWGWAGEEDFGGALPSWFEVSRN